MTDFDVIREEWRTVPTDLGGWANRASQMLHLAERYQTELVRVGSTTATAKRSLPSPDSSRVVVEGE